MFTYLAQCGVDNGCSATQLGACPCSEWKGMGPCYLALICYFSLFTLLVYVHCLPVFPVCFRCAIYIPFNHWWKQHDIAKHQARVLIATLVYATWHLSFLSSLILSFFIWKWGRCFFCTIYAHGQKRQHSIKSRQHHYLWHPHPPFCFFLLFSLFCKLREGRINACPITVVTTDHNTVLGFSCI